jgi:hypothetical protein
MMRIELAEASRKKVGASLTCDQPHNVLRFIRRMDCVVVFTAPLNAQNGYVK